MAVRRISQALAPQPEKRFATAQKPSQNLHPLAASAVNRGTDFAGLRTPSYTPTNPVHVAPYHAQPAPMPNPVPQAPQTPQPLPPNPQPAPMPTPPTPYAPGGNAVDYYNQTGDIRSFIPNAQVGGAPPPDATILYHQADGTPVWLPFGQYDQLTNQQMSQIGIFAAGGNLVGQINPDGGAFGQWSGHSPGTTGTYDQFGAGYVNAGDAPQEWWKGNVSTPQGQPAPMPQPPLERQPFGVGGGTRPPVPYTGPTTQDQYGQGAGRGEHTPYTGERGGAGMDYGQLIDIYNQLPPRTRAEFLNEHPAFSQRLGNQPAPSPQTLSAKPSQTLSQHQTGVPGGTDVRPTPVQPGPSQTPMAASPGGAAFASGEWEPGLPISPQFEAAHRALEDELTGVLSGLNAEESQIGPTVALIVERLRNDELEATRQINEEANARGVYASGGTKRSQDLRAQGFDRNRRDIATDATRQLSDIATRRQGAQNNYMKQLAELILELERNTDLPGTNDDPGPGGNGGGSGGGGKRSGPVVTHPEIHRRGAKKRRNRKAS